MDGAGPITPSMVVDWSGLTGTQIRREEYDMLIAMDIRFREAAAIEQQNNAAIANRDSDSAWT